MTKRALSCVGCLLVLLMSATAYAGGPVGPPPACGPAGGPDCAYWGDAPFPGFCGGVVALPFLVVGSLLGGNAAAPAGPPPAAYRGGPPPKGYHGPRYGAAPPASDSMIAGLPCMEMASSAFSTLAGGGGLLY
jgi:hypothetical protein